MIISGTTFKGHNGDYIISRELGKGGEGQVYELQNNNSLVLKLYNEELDVEKEKKLLYMTGLFTAEIESFAAWPKDVARDKNNKVVGFVMKKLESYVPLHMLFSPMDRKKIFPDKGYNFLVHVARNLASAFYKLHQAGIIVGDVNEGNILVNGVGMLAFIDCDSFQVKEGNKYYFCEVGVARYTPPELLLQGSFEKTIRTNNTDSFSMSILIFQLLVLGRHPFAGKNISNADIDEIDAIKGHQFAYSLNNAQKKLLPPNDSFDIKNISDGLIQLFHQSYEKDTDRPSPDKWINELNLFSKELITCTVSKIHNYPKTLSTCPWCNFSKARGIVYFIDDSYFQINPIADIEGFVNGFKIQPLKLLPKPLTYTKTEQVPDPIDSKFSDFKTYKTACAVLIILLSGCLCFFFNFWFCLPGLLMLSALDKILPFATKINDELKKRNDEFTSLKSQFETLVKEYNKPNDEIGYNNAVIKFTELIKNFKKLPNEFFAARKVIEENLYNQQMNIFLKSFDIRDYSIPSFGAAKKLSLYNNGIQTAADMHKLNSIRISGIGPKNIQTLLSWQRQFISKFIYKPDNRSLEEEIKKISIKISEKKLYLEAEIRNEYNSLQYLHGNIINKQQALALRINAIEPLIYKAELNYLEFKKLGA